MPAHHWVIPGVGAGIGFATGGFGGAAAGYAAGKQLVQGKAVSNVNFTTDPVDPYFGPGSTDIVIEGQGYPPGTRLEIDPVTGVVTPVKRRRRRKRLLSCQDKADIAFLRGQLGGGEMGRTAISSLLSRCG